MSEEKENEYDSGRELYKLIVKWISDQFDKGNNVEEITDQLVYGFATSSKSFITFVSINHPEMKDDQVDAVLESFLEYVRDLAGTIEVKVKDTRIN